MCVLIYSKLFSKLFVILTKTWQDMIKYIYIYLFIFICVCVCVFRYPLFLSDFNGSYIFSTDF